MAADAASLGFTHGHVLEVRVEELGPGNLQPRSPSTGYLPPGNLHDVSYLLTFGTPEGHVRTTEAGRALVDDVTLKVLKEGFGGPGVTHYIRNLSAEGSLAAALLAGVRRQEEERGPATWQPYFQPLMNTYP
ncbi:hypothetical protein HYV82_03925 [Candidatus Woesearchaeota archaeon]|nr:hypothetical protein [Candidatus Woesearchaeota archaeon]